MPTTITPEESAAIRREIVMELWKKFVQAAIDVDEILDIVWTNADVPYDPHSDENRVDELCYVSCGMGRLPGQVGG